MNIFWHQMPLLVVRDWRFREGILLPKCSHLCCRLAVVIGLLFALGQEVAAQSSTRSTWTVEPVLKRLVPPDESLTGTNRYTHQEEEESSGLVGVPLDKDIRIGLYLKMSTDGVDSNEGVGTGSGVGSIRGRFGMTAQQVLLLLSRLSGQVQLSATGGINSTTLRALLNGSTWTTRITRIGRPNERLSIVTQAEAMGSVYSMSFNAGTAPPMNSSTALWCAPDTSTNSCEIFVGVLSVPLLMAAGALQASDVGFRLIFSLGSIGSQSTSSDLVAVDGDIMVDLEVRSGNTVSYYICAATGCGVHAYFAKPGYTVSEDNGDTTVGLGANEIRVGVTLANSGGDLASEVTVPIQILPGTAPASSYRIHYLYKSYPSSGTINLVFPIGSPGTRYIDLTTIPNDVDASDRAEKGTVTFTIVSSAVNSSVFANFRQPTTTVTIEDNDFPEVEVSFEAVSGESVAIEGARNDRQLQLRANLDFLELSNSYLERDLAIKFEAVYFHGAEDADVRVASVSGPIRDGVHVNQLNFATKTLTFSSNARGDDLGIVFVVEAVKDSTREPDSVQGRPEQLVLRVIRNGQPIGVHAGTSATVTLRDAPPDTVVLSLDKSSVSEQSGGTDIMITGTLALWSDDTLGQAIIVTLEKSAGSTAIEGEGKDFVWEDENGNVQPDLIGTKQLVFPVGKRNGESVPVEVRIEQANDRIVETDETIVIGGHSTSRVMVEPVSFIILDDDRANTRISSPGSDVKEGNDAKFEVTFSSQIEADVTIDWLVSDEGQAKNVNVREGTAMFPNPALARHPYPILIGILDDLKPERDEIIEVGFVLRSEIPMNRLRFPDSKQLKTAYIEESDLLTVRITGPTMLREGSAGTFTMVVEGGETTANITAIMRIHPTSTETIDDLVQESLPQPTVLASAKDRKKTFELEVQRGGMSGGSTPSNTNTTPDSHRTLILRLIDFSAVETDDTKNLEDTEDTIELDRSPHKTYVVDTAYASIVQLENRKFEEGDTIEFEIELDKPLPSDKIGKVDWTITQNPEKPSAGPNDFGFRITPSDVLPSGTVTFVGASSETARVVTDNVRIYDDGSPEFGEAFRIELEMWSGELTDNQVSVVINDADESEYVLEGEIEVNDYFVAEIVGPRVLTRGSQGTYTVQLKAVSTIDRSLSSTAFVVPILLQHDGGQPVSPSSAPARMRSLFDTAPMANVTVTVPGLTGATVGFSAGEIVGTTQYNVDLSDGANEHHHEQIAISIMKPQNKPPFIVSLGDRSGTVVETLLKLPEIQLEVTNTDPIYRDATSASITVDATIVGDSAQRSDAVTVALSVESLDQEQMPLTNTCVAGSIVFPIGVSSRERTFACDIANFSGLTSIPALRVLGSAPGYVVRERRAGETIVSAYTHEIVLSISDRRVVEGGPATDIRVGARFLGLSPPTPTIVEIAIKGDSGTVPLDFASTDRFNVTIPASSRGEGVSFFTVKVDHGSIVSNQLLYVVGDAFPYEVAQPVSILLDNARAKNSDGVSRKFIRFGRSSGGNAVGWSSADGAFTDDSISSASFSIDGSVYELSKVWYTPNDGKIHIRVDPEFPVDHRNLGFRIGSDEIRATSGVHEHANRYSFSGLDVVFTPSSMYTELTISRHNSVPLFFPVSTVGPQTWYRRYTAVNLALPSVSPAYGNKPISYRLEPEIPEGLVLDVDGTGDCGSRMTLCGTPGGYDNLGTTTYSLYALDPVPPHGGPIEFSVTMESVLDMNDDGQVDRFDGSIIYFVFNFPFLLGYGGPSPSPGIASFREDMLGPFLDYTASNATERDADLRELIRTTRERSTLYRDLLNFDGRPGVGWQDGQLVVNVFSVPNRVGDGITGGTYGGRKKQIGGYLSSGSATPDAELIEIVREINRFAR